MLAYRLLTAAVLAPPLVYLILAGPAWGFLIVNCLAAAVGVYEFVQISARDESLVIKGLCVAQGVVLTALAYFHPSWLAIAPAFVVVITFSAILVRPEPIEGALVRFSLLLTAIVYAAGLLLFMSLIRTGRSDGGAWLILAMTVIWLGDTGAYFSGRFLGRHKIYPLVSPKKTVEGSIGGIVAGIVGAIGVKLILIDYLTWVDCVLIAAPASVIGQMGDFCESILKRSFGVKDSGAILPGHGGLLDRVDALMFASPYVFVYQMYLV